MARRPHERGGLGVAASDRWADLGPRVATALVLVLIGGLAIWWGGWVYIALMLLLLAGIIWELTGITAGAPLWMRIVWCLIITFGVVVLGMMREFGIGPVVWLIGVVIASDVGAYFAGRMIGGPKLWPAVSPGKTISGAIGGLILAMIVGAWIAGQFSLPFLLWHVLLASFVVSLASMGGDLVQSAIKRMFGVKDSGTLLPGHGGLWDRFDGMIGAAYGFVFVLIFIL